MVSPMDYFGKRLFAGILPINKNEFAGTIPRNKNELMELFLKIRTNLPEQFWKSPSPPIFLCANARVSIHDVLGGRVAGRDIIRHPGI